LAVGGKIEVGDNLRVDMTVGFGVTALFGRGCIILGSSETIDAMRITVVLVNDGFVDVKRTVLGTNHKREHYHKIDGTKAYQSEALYVNSRGITV
jgi:hypothetical protein